jgi:hypothetical protein
MRGGGSIVRATYRKLTPIHLAEYQYPQGIQVKFFMVTIDDDVELFDISYPGKLIFIGTKFE